MKRLAAISALCALFSTAFAAGWGGAARPGASDGGAEGGQAVEIAASAFGKRGDHRKAAAGGEAAAGENTSGNAAAPADSCAAGEADWPDSLRSLLLYTEAVKQRTIYGDSTQARALLREAVACGSLFAPAWYELAAGGLYDTPGEGISQARRAYRLDTANLWYLRLYGQMQLLAGRYREALPLFRRLQERDPKEPDNYRILAALYEQNRQPFAAIITLDSAEMRFGRIPLLSRMKRQLLIATNQHGRAIDEARALVEEEPYEAGHHTVLADLYALTGRDSLAVASYRAALRIDSTNLGTLTSFYNFYSDRRDYRAMLGILRRIFERPEMPLDAKIRRFEALTADINFYREHYFALNDLAACLSILYPSDPGVVELYARHLVASGELDRALEHYKLHTADEPPRESYYRAIIDIESYKQRPDSVRLYLDRALALFPDRPELHITGGNIYYYTKQYDEAIRAYRASLRYADSDSLRSAVWCQIGDVRHQQAEAAEQAKARNRYRKASYDAYRQALRYDPDNAMALNNWAYFLATEGGDLEEALRMADRVDELTDNNPTYLDTRAWILFRLGRLKEARRVMQQAIALDGQKSRELLVHYGDILHALGEQFMAETYWKKALEKGYEAAAIEERLARPRVVPPAEPAAGKAAETPAEPPANREPSPGK